MYVLGINPLHDTSAALVKDGRIIGAIEEERLNRQKHTTAFPTKAIKWLLNHANIDLTDVDKVVTSFELRKFNGNKNPFEFNTICHDDASTEGLRKIAADNKLTALSKAREMENNGFNDFVGIPHHFAHAAGAYCLSGFGETNILIIDGRGENVSTSLMVGKNGDMEILKQYSIKDSLGHLYTYVTYLAGLYSSIGQEGKTMGLAPYGVSDSELTSRFNKILRVNRGEYSIDGNEMRKLKVFARPLGRIDRVSMNLAFQVQKQYERALMTLAEKQFEQTGFPYFALSGGVTLNCEGNRVLLSQDFVKKIYIQPAANDGGSSLGAALYWCAKSNKSIGRQEDSYLGPQYTNDEIEQIISLCKLTYERDANPANVAAELLKEEKIIAWFQGGMEFGPRALGNRSILANPSVTTMKDRINKYVKHREEWRPFAPSILLERMSEYFDIQYEAPHMTISFLVNQSMRQRIAAATHIDGTARIQTVTKERNGRFYDLIVKFQERTGIPAVLNTSFNVRGEPIVCSPTDAVMAFFSTGLDALIIGNYVISKEVEAHSPLKSIQEVLTQI